MARYCAFDSANNDKLLCHHLVSTPPITQPTILEDNRVWGTPTIPEVSYSILLPERSISAARDLSSGIAFTCTDPCNILWSMPKDNRGRGRALDSP